MSDDNEQGRRDAILSQAWSRLDVFEVEHPERPYATLLRMRSANPQAGSQQLAEIFSHQKGVSISAAEYRRLLQLARRKLEELLDELDGCN
jgi:hypothetical protein